MTTTVPAFDPRVGATLTDLIEAKASECGEKVFLTYLADGRQTTYSELDRQTSSIGRALLSSGLQQGAHVALLMDNCPEQLLAIWAIGRVGLVAVPVSTAAKGRLLAYFLNHSDSVALIVEESLLARFLEVAGECTSVRSVYVARVPREDRVGGEIGAGAFGTGSFPDGLQMRAFDDLLGSAAAQPARRPRFSDLAMLMYTSGTTGPSKAIMFSHAQLIYWGRDVAVQHEYVPEDIAYVFLPMFHGNAHLSAALPALIAGAGIALAPRLSVRNFWSDVRRSGATIFNGLGPVAHYLWERPPAPDDREHLLNRCHLVPVPAFARAFQSRFNVRIMSAFGLTDYCRGAAYNSRCSDEKLGSAGLPIPGVDVRIVDADDLPVPVGERGEIVLRNNAPWAASMGYYKDAEATLASRRNLWFHTGDRGWFDAEGYLWYADRLKDSIRRRGENISAFEVEDVIRRHPAVLEVAVYAVRAESAEDEVAASLVLRPGVAFSEMDLIEHCNRNLAHFMVPRYVEVIDTMPLTASQKIEKYKLRTRAEQRLHLLWDREHAGVRLRR